MLPDNLSPDAVRTLFAPEMRAVAVPLQDLEWRESGSGDGSRVLTGYAAVYEQMTTLYAGTYYTMREVIRRGAFDAVLAARPDVHLNIGHDMSRAVARTGIRGVGGLELTADEHGLKVYARLNKDDPDVCALSAKMDLGIMDQMSFAFLVLPSGCKYETETDDGGHETDTRSINEIAELCDVCVCAQGAYPTTEAALRSILRDGAHVVTREVPDSGSGAETVAPDTDGAGSPVGRQLAILQARACVARSRYRPKGLPNDNRGTGSCA